MSQQTEHPSTAPAAPAAGGFRRRYTRYPGNGRTVALRPEAGNLYTVELIDDSLGGFCAAFADVPPLRAGDRVEVSGICSPRMAVVRNVARQRSGVYYLGCAWERSGNVLETEELRMIAEFPVLVKRWRFFGDKAAWPLLTHAIRQFLYSTVEFDFGDVRRLSRRIVELLEQHAPADEVRGALATLCDRMLTLAHEAQPAAE